MKKKSNNKPIFKKSIYQDLEEKDLHRIMDEKDQFIRKLQFKLQKLQRQNQQLVKAGSGEGNLISIYKQKISQEIQQNDKAFQLFLTISDRILKLIQMLNSVSELNDQSSSVKGLLKMMGDASLSSQSKSEVYSEEDQDQPQNMQAIQNQVEKRFQELETICDIFHKNFIKNQKQAQDIEKRLKTIKKDHSDQVRILSNELKQARTEKIQFKSLLQKNEDEKNQILAKIANVLDSKTRKEVQKMNRDELIQYIKKLMYRISELETSKTEVIKQNKKIKTQDLEKYKKILNQVKQFKEASRLGRSVM